MLPHTHFLVAFTAGLLLRQFSYLSFSQALIIGVLSALVDIDHLFTYYVRHKRWSFRGAWNAAVVKHEQVKKRLGL